MAFTLDNYHTKAIKDYGLHDSWPQEVLTEAKLIPVKVNKDQNFLDLPFVTIDGEDAKDFDDAIYCEMVPEGFNLKVAIADVSYYVKEQSAIDLEALNRATSTYFPKKVIPMLPEILSNEICSLKPEKYRRTMMADVVLDKTGTIVRYEFKQVMIKSSARLTYNQVNLLFQDKNTFAGNSFEQSLAAALTLHQLLLKNKNNSSEK